MVQRRQDGSVDFNRTWLEYEDGFGNLAGEFWYGLRALLCLTGQGGWEMRMDITLSHGRNMFLQYELFKVASTKDKYKLTVARFQSSSRTFVDPMAAHNGRYFTTKDRDNDVKLDGNCALLHGPTRPSGGWWHRRCWWINPNGLYKNFDGIRDLSKDKWHTLPFIEIKIRPNNCNI